MFGKKAGQQMSLPKLDSFTAADQDLSIYPITRLESWNGFVGGPLRGQILLATGLGGALNPDRCPIPVLWWCADGIGGSPAGHRWSQAGQRKTIMRGSRVLNDRDCLPAIRRMARVFCIGGGGPEALHRDMDRGGDMRRLGVLVLGVVLIATRSASAQDTSRGELSGGWRYYHATFSGTTSAIPASNHRTGWYADAAFNLSPTLAIVGEAGGSYSSHDFTGTGTGLSVTVTSDVKFHTFMGGVRLRAPQVPRLVPFGQVLFGGEHDASINETVTTVAQRTSRSRREGSSSSAALALDGGATLALGAIGVRASAGYARFFGAADVDAFRFSLGAAFRF